jgi:hypothetical protein
MDAFYQADGDQFISSELTRGPWDPKAQHAGPPAALIGRALEALPNPTAPGREAEQAAGSDSVFQLGRVTYEILRPVPIAPLRVRAEVVRPGRSVQLLTASLLAGDEEVIRASAWRLARREIALPTGFASEDPESPARRSAAPPGLDRAVEEPFFETGQAVGYHSAMEYRFAAGSFRDPGPAVVWMRMRHPLVADESPTPLQRALIVADTGNGASATLDWGRYLFINVDLSVHLHRLPAGEWVCLDAVTVPEPTGIGLAESSLWDERGPIGRALQTLLVRER